MALGMTLLVGMFIFFGGLIVFITNNNKKVVNYAISIGFGVLISLIMLELIPESIELLETEYSALTTTLLMFVLIAVGIGVLKLLDLFIPDHDMKEDDNMLHIGVMTSVALFIHNVIEGMTVYTSFSSSSKLGIMLALGVALHNIPLGMTVTSFFYKNKKKGRAIIGNLIVSLSTFIGGIIAYLLRGILFSDIILGIILTITLGMLIYIVLFELLPHIMHSDNKKKTILGILIGVMVLVISLFLE